MSGRAFARCRWGGNLSRLPFAEGLADFERPLARAVCFRAQHMPGTLMLRRLMGHCATGARVCHGECVFMTWSPNEQHSCTVLRLMRTREADPLLEEPKNAPAPVRDFHAALKKLNATLAPSMRTFLQRIMPPSLCHYTMCGRSERLAIHRLSSKLSCTRRNAKCPGSLA